MKDEIVSFETAVLALEKGFDVPIEQKGHVYDLYSGSIDINISSDHIRNWNRENYIGVCSAPTQSLLQRWLREVHVIHIEIRITNLGRYYWCYHQFNMENVFNVTFWVKQNISSVKNDSYEQALEAGLLEALKLI